MKQLSFRLRPGQLLKEEIERLAVERNISAGVLLSIVGGLQHAVLRMAGSTPENSIEKIWNEKLEIVSGTGTISKEGCHIHLSCSTGQGNVIGGHLKDGCVVATTAEIVIGIFDDVEFHRTLDDKTGYNELSINTINT